MQEFNFILNSCIFQLNFKISKINNPVSSSQQTLHLYNLSFIVQAR